MVKSYNLLICFYFHGSPRRLHIVLCHFRYIHTFISSFYFAIKKHQAPTCITLVTAKHKRTTWFHIMWFTLSALFSFDVLCVLGLNRRSPHIEFLGVVVVVVVAAALFIEVTHSMVRHFSFSFLVFFLCSWFHLLPFVVVDVVLRFASSSFCVSPSASNRWQKKPFLTL